MRHFSFVFVAALALSAFGCKKKAPDCAAAISHSMDLAKADMQKEAGDPKAMQAMADLGLKHCKDDKWSDDAVRCMMDAKSKNDAQACYGKLTQDQRDKMNAEVMVGKPPPDMAVPTGSGSAAPAGSGSDMGSAAVGSGSATANSGSAAAGSGSGAGPGSAK